MNYDHDFRLRPKKMLLLQNRISFVHVGEQSIVVAVVPGVAAKCYDLGGVKNLQVQAKTCSSLAITLIC